MQHTNDSFRGSRRRRRRRRSSSPVMYILAVVFVVAICCVTFFIARSLSSKKSTPKQVDSPSAAATTAAAGSPGKKASDLTIFLDPGHGGNEAGSRNDTVTEKEVNLQITKRIQTILESQGFQVVSSRKDDTAISLENRLKAAKKAKADLLVSIHQNSLDNDTVTNGMQTYCNESVNAKSAAFADLVHKDILALTNAKDRGVTKDSNLYMVQSDTIPSCLVETGFLTAESEGKLLTQADYQNKIALGIVNAICEYTGIEKPDPAKLPTEAETEAPSESAAANGTTVSGEPTAKEKVVYITIDDGPTTGTPKILDILDKYDAKATWFVTGQYLEGSALTDMLKQIHDRGNAIGVHTFSHAYRSIYKSVDAYLADYEKMNKIIVDAVGESSDMFRFPGGSNAGYNKKIRSELLKRVKSEGLVYYDWNAFTGDTEGKSKSQMVQKAIKESSYNNKTILLMHDVPGKDAVVEALPEILAGLKKEGYQFRALDKNVVPIQFAK